MKEIVPWSCTFYSNLIAPVVQCQKLFLPSGLSAIWSYLSDTWFAHMPSGYIDPCSARSRWHQADVRGTPYICLPYTAPYQPRCATPILRPSPATSMRGEAHALSRTSTKYTGQIAYMFWGARFLTPRNPFTSSYPKYLAAGQTGGTPTHQDM